MIDRAMNLLANEAQQYLRLRAKLNAGVQKVVLTPVVDEQGVMKIPTDTVGLSLINIEEERVLKTQGRVMKRENGHVNFFNPEIRINAYILFAANFAGYAEGLKFLSMIISFFQAKNVFNHTNAPGLDPEMEQLVVDLYSMTLEQQNYLWGALGAKYLPSVAYQMRLVLLQDRQLVLSGPPVMEVEIKDARMEPVS